MEFIRIDDIYRIAEVGDKLEGKLYVYPTGLSDSKFEVKQLTFWNCISCLLDKEEVIDGADYFLKKRDDGTFEKYGIIREVNGLLKVPKEFIMHVVNKFQDINDQGEFSISAWDNWELINCYCEHYNIKGDLKYTCCVNEYGDSYTEDFKTLTAVWTYLASDMYVKYCHELDNKIFKMECAIDELNKRIVKGGEKNED